MAAKYTPPPWKWTDVPSAGIQISATVPEGARVGLHSYRTETDDGGTGMLFTLREAPLVQLADARWVQFSRPEWNEMQVANARLMVSAPELLQELQDLLWKFEHWHEFQLPERNAFLESAPIYIRAAIAKAVLPEEDSAVED